MRRLDHRRFEANDGDSVFELQPVARGTAERVIGARTTAAFFTVFGVRPALGRAFTDPEDQPGHEQVVVLSHRLWTRRFAADSAIVGRDVRLGGSPFSVIGIMPASFDLNADTEELWVPIAFTPQPERPRTTSTT